MLVFWSEWSGIWGLVRDVRNKPATSPVLAARLKPTSTCGGSVWPGRRDEHGFACRYESLRRGRTSELCKEHSDPRFGQRNVNDSQCLMNLVRPRNSSAVYRDILWCTVYAHVLLLGCVCLMTAKSGNHFLNKPLEEMGEAQTCHVLIHLGLPAS